MDIIAAIAEELQIKKGQTEAAVKLIDEGNTIPFIARYRKEATGSLNDEVLRNLFDRLTYLRNLEDKKQTVLASIEEQGKLTDELKKAILEAQTQVAVDDLYRPYRPKRRTRATIAKEKGLEPLAQTILAQESSVDIMAEAAKYVDAEKDVADLRAFAKDELGIADPQPWDWTYISEKLKEARYAFSEQEVKQYFTAPKVLAGLFKIIETLFDVAIRRDEAAVWNPSVQFYRLERNDRSFGISN